jgi:hypothetical protein
MIGVAVTMSDDELWNIDGRNKDAITLFSPQFSSSPDGPHHMPKMKIDRYAKDCLAFGIGAAHGYAVKERPKRLITDNYFVRVQQWPTGSPQRGHLPCPSITIFSLGRSHS